MAEYYLGLDMGTSSVGWAVTDLHYRLIRAKRKDLWGIREFDEALTSVDRRTHRISRRRRQRELVRIGLLKEYFHDAIMEIDPLFYIRLENSKYHLEDKKEEVKNKNGIFNDTNYTDQDYYEEFPTIFHLRKELMENAQEHDVRLVFLALLNMFKHRGHFLNAGLSSEEHGRKIEEIYEEFRYSLQEYLEVKFPEKVEEGKLSEILSDKGLSRTGKAEKLSELFGVEKKQKKESGFIKGICGLKIDANILFEGINTEDKVTICFSDFGYEDKIEEILTAVGEENYHIIELMKEMYDMGVLAAVMGGYKYLSEARVADYNKHKQDLIILKKVIKKYETEQVYDLLFRSEEAGSYSAYVNSTNSGKKSRRNMKGRKKEDFYKLVNKCIKKFPTEDEDVAYILGEIEKDTFMPKQLTASNGVIPNQVHKMEMKKILQNAEEYLSFLKNVDESGLTTSERILQLFSFQIPYYIGPVSEKSAKNGGNGWVVRKESGQVLPWNLEEKVDVGKTSEQFISRLVRKCTYINGESVLPKASLEYESFCVLNEINNLKINGEKISVEIKQDIYRDLFETGKKVTKKQLVKYLFGKGVLAEESQLSGIDININNSLSSYGKFKAIFGEKMKEDGTKKMVEEIIFWCTVYGDAKKILKDQLKKHYENDLSEEQMKRILGFKFKDWGNLSKEFLELSGCDKSTGEIMSLIRAMWNTNYNLMELLHSDGYTYNEELEKRQAMALKCLGEIEPEDLDEFYFSAPVKRMVWQTILIIREVQKIMGGAPKRIFIEMTRGDEQKGDAGRKASRKQQLLDLYKNIKEEYPQWKEIIENADSSGKLRSKKMYLYCTQMGRCMYTGERIDLDDLFNDNLYDIDHIYPRHFVKDDNIGNNLVLVKKEINAHKSDEYPLEHAILSSAKVRNLWETLRKYKLINEEKYRRLTRTTPFSLEEKAGFIARQLVETSQGTKGVADLLKQVLPETEVVYSKAANVSEFRHTRGFVKCRSVNDFHHAQDAYLNIVVGNTYFVKFTQNPLHFIKKEYLKDEKKHHYNLSRMFDWDVVRGNEVAWRASTKESTGTIDTVREVMAKNTPLLTRMNFEGHGGIANETLYGAKKAKEDNYIPLKASDERMADVRKYGGYTSVSTAYFFLVEHEVKGKKIRTLETIPVYLKEKIEKNEGGLLLYCKEELGLVNPSVRVKKIKIQSVFKRNGFLVNLTGKTGNQLILRNTISLCLKQYWNDYIKKIENYCEQGRMSDTIVAEKNIELYGLLKDKHQEGIYKNRPNPVGEKLAGAFEKFEELTVEEQCNVLMEILKLSAIGLQAANLTAIGESANTGKMLMSKNIAGTEELILINQSVTGVFESRIDLLTV